MPLSAPSRRDRAAADAEAAERQRSVRERLEATVSGLEELEYLRQRQAVLVRTALELREGKEKDEERQREAQLNSEEKLLEENILLLRKQLNCLRRRDAGLITQLQELDRQISDLRLDTEASHDQLENDSRPSSGFYELSDGASGSLSNSSNSVFSECFCSMAEADGRLLSADELASCLECDSLVGGLCDDSSSSGTVRRSLSAPHPATLDPVSLVAACDSQSKYHCDLVARNGSEVFRYPSPLHAVAVQSPVFLQMLGPSRDEGLLKSVEAGVEGLKPESSPVSASVSAPFVSQSSSWPAPSSFSSHTPSLKRLDSYIYSLLQRRALPVRTSRPRTSISTDPSKSILRQASLCVRQVSGFGLGTLRGSEFKCSWTAGGASAENSSPQRQWSVESKSEEQETQNVFPNGSVDTMQNGFKINNSDLAENQNSSSLSIAIQNGSSVTNKDIDTNSLMKQKSKRFLPPSAVSTATLPKDSRELGIPKANFSPKDSKQPCYFPDQELLLRSPPVIKTSSATPNNSLKPPQALQTEKVDRSVPEIASLVFSHQSQDEAGGERGEGEGSHMVNAKYFLAQRQNVKLRKGGSKNVKTVKAKTTTTMKMSRASEHNETTSERSNKSHHRSSSKNIRLLEDGGSVNIKVSKRAAGGGAHGVSTSRIKRLPASIPEGRVLDKHATSTLSSVRSGASRHHHHGNHHHHGHHHHHNHVRDQVVVIAKPKYKRNDYRRLRAIMEVPYDEALRRAQRRQKKELLSQSAANVYLPSAKEVSSPYSYVAGSDSEYSAECASLFHSTIVDTSEDEKSNYTTNCFGDSESSEEDYVEESATTSDTEESGGGGAGGGTGGMGRGWSKLGTTGARAVGQEMTPAQAKAFVKIKASHNLKKKILRFRSGSLKLMTTV
ncbi:LOW QUALITY PROTEIN: dapper homolog 1 [Cottoperca gobio]|uniref:LOW QUALITY PROTEIN: dapper homolog 1 n=1 Tax=Cottoperca gobio TaxID=56716 RepID=A0A6J2S407_COTGO|nr:LOW QUALITY PROTEIN: dapper homolog 1-like [Cottoperca gobio]